MELKETLYKMYEKSGENFNALVETMKRKAAKGLLEGVTPEDIEDVVSNIYKERSLVENKNEHLEILGESFTSEIAEITEAENYYNSILSEELNKELNSLSESELEAFITYAYLYETIGIEETDKIINEGAIIDGIKSGIAGGTGLIKKAVTSGISGLTKGAVASLPGIGLTAAALALHHRKKKKREMTESMEHNNTILSPQYKELITQVLSEASDDIELDENNEITKEILSYITESSTSVCFQQDDSYDYGLLEDIMNEADAEDMILEQSDNMFKAKHDVDEYVTKKNLHGIVMLGHPTRKSSNMAARMNEKVSDDEELSNLKSEIEAEMSKTPIDRKKVKELYKKYKKIYKEKKHSLKKSAKDDIKVEKVESRKTKNLYEMNIFEVLYE